MSHTGPAFALHSGTLPFVRPKRADQQTQTESDQRAEHSAEKREHEKLLHQVGERNNLSRGSPAKDDGKAIDHAHDKAADGEGFGEVTFGHSGARCCFAAIAKVRKGNVALLH